MTDWSNERCGLGCALQDQVRWVSGLPGAQVLVQRESGELVRVHTGPKNRSDLGRTRIMMAEYMPEADPENGNQIVTVAHLPGIITGKPRQLCLKLRLRRKLALFGDFAQQ